MAELSVSSQSSFLLLRPKTGILHNPRTAISLSLSGAGAPCLRFAASSNQARSLRLGVVSDPTAPSLFTVDSGTKGIVIEPEIGGSGGGDGGDSGGRGGGGGGGGGGDHSDGRGEEGADDSSKKKGMSMSQKLTLAYALLVGVGGVMGFLKSGSNKSLLAGGISASLLYLVYTELPKRTVFASSLGLGLSAALLVVMGSRFKRSGKIFPAGVVSLVSLIMTGGYFHGILRGMH
ncbi:putative TMEM14 family protein [Rosa chinensis]|uniref:Putative TMEM14 family protein n=1 Tax=Rosa chinensis TaxID=74649 RepID=A0A2P6RL42_ROSCH|nr:protein FATTY ACID EXPORT 2, chloroplastic [Rosa chinensis]PRQ47148.1 putative TMEM14 family protein [Rosa chinensis]